MLIQLLGRGLPLLILMALGACASHPQVDVSKQFSDSADWAIDSRSVFVEVQEDGLDYSVFVNEATAIVNQMSRDGVVEK